MAAPASSRLRLGRFPIGDYAEIASGGVLARTHHLVLPWITLASLVVDLAYRALDPRIGEAR